MSWRVLFQMATVGAYTALVKVAGAAKVVVTARAFGMSDGLDAYLIAFLVAVIRVRYTGRIAESGAGADIHRSARTAGTRCRHTAVSDRTGCGSGIARPAAIGGGRIRAVDLLRSLASSFDPTKWRLTCSLFWVMLPIVPLSAMNMIWRSILNTEGHFALPAVILPALTPLVVDRASCCVRPELGRVCAGGGNVGRRLAEVALLAVAMLRQGLPILPRWSGRNAALDQVMAQYGAGDGRRFCCSAGAPLIDQSIAAMLGSGSVAALNYGTRVSAVLVAMGPGAVATAILPHFSKLTVSRTGIMLRQSLRSYAAIILGGDSARGRDPDALSPNRWSGCFSSAASSPARLPKWSRAFSVSPC